MSVSKKMLKRAPESVISMLYGTALLFLAPVLCGAEASFIDGPFTVSAGPYRYQINGNAVWKYTQQDFFYDNTHFVRRGGQNSAVLTKASGQHIGGYHTEGGTEQVLEFVMRQTVGNEEKTVRPEAGKTYDGPVSMFRRSRLDNLELRETQHIDAERIVITRSFTALEAQPVHHFCLFMWCWHPDFTNWYAELADGTPAEGEFSGDNGWKMSANIRYTAVYNSKAGKGMIIFFPQVIPAMPPRRATYWDVGTAYRKFYHFLNVPKTVQKGYQSPEYTVILQGFSADADTWKDTVRQIAGKLKQNVDESTSADSAAAVKKAVAAGPMPGRPGGGKIVCPLYGDLSNEDWLENRRGIEALADDYVFPIFTPVKAEKSGRAEVWNRVYTIAPGGLPRQVRIGKEDFLKKPLELELSIGKAQAVTFSPPELVKAARGRVEYVSRANAENASVEARTTIEYDGMIRHDLTITPDGAASVEGLTYRVRIPSENARFYRYDGARTNQRVSVCVPRNTHAGVVPNAEGTVWQDAFKTLVWLGNHENGFLWFAESEQHWNPQPRTERMNACRIVRVGDEVVLEIQPISARYDITAPITITSGFFATPVRPMPEGWRGWSMQYMAMWDKAKILYHQHEWRHPKGSAMYNRIHDPQSYRERVASYAAKGQLAMPYFDMRLMWLGNLKNPGTRVDRDYTPPDLHIESGTTQDIEWEYQPPEVVYYNEWRTVPSLIYSYGAKRGGREGSVSWQSGWTDFFCFKMEKHAELGSRGCSNFDEWMPVPDMNELHGAGYVDQNGVRRVTYQTFAQRDAMKRICHVYLEKTGKPPVWNYHPGNTLVLPASTHFTGILYGESLNSLYHVSESYYDEHTIADGRRIVELLKDKDVRYWYYHVKSPEQWQAEFYGAPYGLPIFLMAQYWKDPNMDKVFAKSREAERDFMINPLLHDNLLFPVFVGAQSAYTYFGIREKFNIADDSVVFYPYWAETRPARTLSDKMLVSSYQNKGSWLVIAANTSLDSVTTRVEINPRMIKAPATVINAETDVALKLERGRVDVTLPPRDYVIIRIDEK